MSTLFTTLSRQGLHSTMASLFLACATFASSCAQAQTSFGYLPDDTARHEGTWLQWPHHYTYGRTYRDRIEPTWVAMTRALVTGEKVHIIVYDSVEQTRVRNKLTAAGVSLANVSFLIRKTDDVWVRDNGPVFVYDANNKLQITDWGFNGWGYDTAYRKDDTVPVAVASALAMPRVDVNDIILEGGAVVVDGQGVLMATRSSILEPARNPYLSQGELETALADNFGVAKFIWLDGAPGGKEDITDMHIDGFAMFGMPDTIITMSRSDLSYWGLPNGDIDRLYAATNIDNVPYKILQLPLTSRNVVTTYGYNLGFKGSYTNFYVTNNAVLMPTYNDPNDAVAKSILQGHFIGRTVIGIDSRNLYREGGMVHCVTQQQPAAP